MSLHVAVIGLGYVGLPLAVALARSGVHVIGFDSNADRANSLASGISPIADVSHSDLQAALDAGFQATSESDHIIGRDAYVICVPTPLSASGGPDLSHVDAAVETVGSVMKQGSLIVLESTTYPGTTEERVLPHLEQVSGLSVVSDFFLAYSPERIDPGNTTYSVVNTPKIVGGVDSRSTELACQLYSHLGIHVVVAKGTREAELAKLLENTYRQVNIALVNEMSQFCHALDIDIYDAIRCAATKPFGFQAFWPGPGVGGHCIPIDPSYLSYRVRAQLGYPFRFAELAQEVNAGMPKWVVERIVQGLNGLQCAVRGSSICLLGVAYKAGVQDIRESPALEIAKLLLSLGATVSYYDPQVPSFEVGTIQVPQRTLSDLQLNPTDVVVLLQRDPSLDAVDLDSLGRLVVNTRGIES